MSPRHFLRPHLLGLPLCALCALCGEISPSGILSILLILSKTPLPRALLPLPPVVFSNHDPARPTASSPPGSRGLSARSPPLAPATPRRPHRRRRTPPEATRWNRNPTSKNCSRCSTQRLERQLIPVDRLDSALLLNPDSCLLNSFPPCRSPVRIDLLTSLTGVTWEEARAHRVAGQYGEVPVHFIGKTEYIRNKKATGRKKDEADIEALGGDSPAP